MTTLLPRILDGLIQFSATHHLMMIAVDSRNSEFDVDRISNYQGGSIFGYCGVRGREKAHRAPTASTVVSGLDGLYSRW